MLLRKSQKTPESLSENMKVDAYRVWISCGSILQEIFENSPKTSRKEKGDDNSPLIKAKVSSSESVFPKHPNTFARDPNGCLVFLG